VSLKDQGGGRRDFRSVCPTGREEGTEAGFPPWGFGKKKPESSSNKAYFPHLIGRRKNLAYLFPTEKRCGLSTIIYYVAEGGGAGLLVGAERRGPSCSLV